jgi:hypothetical protein
MSVPTPKMFATGPLVNPNEALAAIKDFQEKFEGNRFVPNNKIEILKPKPSPRPRTECSIPVRNPAFREHDGLKALQRKLHTQNK